MLVLDQWHISVWYPFDIAGDVKGRVEGGSVALADGDGDIAQRVLVDVQAELERQVQKRAWLLLLPRWRGIHSSSLARASSTHDCDIPPQKRIV